MDNNLQNLINKEDSIYIAKFRNGWKCHHKKLQSLGYRNLLLPNRNEVNLLDFEAVSKWFEINKPKL